ncbi:hypothetical protein PQX77_002919 [Marasmius sp. AFHP31]|nr:hypothetical protein PQX77_002919 [Marasmius sp. AFHP31]
MEQSLEIKEMLQCCATRKFGAILSINNTVSQFDLLPEMPKKSSRPSAYHFDVRYIPIEPYPSHILFILNTTTNAKHIERLPVDLDERTSGIEFFPETAEHAAPEVAKGLVKHLKNDLYVFTEGGSGSGTSVSTDDPTLSKAVAAELKKLGYPRAQVQTKSIVLLAQREFDDAFREMKRKASPPLNPTVASLLQTPESIGFHNFRPPSLETFPDVENEVQERQARVTQYLQYLTNARPAQSLTDLRFNIMEEMAMLERLFVAKPLDVIKREAEQGVAESQLDYALRLRTGIQTAPNLRLCRDILAKTAINPNAPPVTRSIAHANLMNWHTSCSDFRTRNMFLAVHHANQALIHASDKPSPAVMHFSKELEGNIHTYRQPVVKHMYEKLWAAKRKRDIEYAEEIARNGRKRLQRPNAYRCANVGCGMEASHGKLFQKCGGKCDADKKPSYCGQK